MRSWPLAVAVLNLLIFPIGKSDGISSPPAVGATVVQTYPAKGVVQEIRTNSQTVVIKHEAISNYMDAMIMPFKVAEPSALANLSPGDEVTFQLHVTETASWVDQIKKTGAMSPPQNKGSSDYEPVMAVKALPGNPLRYYKFTNELGQAVSLNDFRGQALGIIFFYTRCPLPDYCPRLSKNFQEASQKLAAMPNAPTNWHFLSISFDPETDTPSLLKAYGEMYHYDPAHWTFLTGPPDKISELAGLSGVTFQRDGVLLNHNLRTLIIDANNRLQTVFPMGGDLSDAIVAEMLKAAAVTNGSSAQNPDGGGSQTAKTVSSQPVNPAAR